MASRELDIKIKGKDQASPSFKKVEKAADSLAGGLRGVQSAAKSTAGAIGKITGIAGLFATFKAAAVGGQMLMTFFRRAQEQSGDFGREMSRLNDVINRVAKVVGDLLAPALSLFVDWLDKIIPKTLEVGNVLESDLGKRLLDIADRALDWGANIVAQLARGIVEGIATSLTWAMDQIGKMLSWFLAPGSPPRVAPNLDKWGKAWTETILKGMTEADFSVLESIQGQLQTVLGLTGKQSKFGDLTAQIAEVISSGSGMEALLERLRKVGGKFGDSLAQLAQKHFDVAKAAEAVEEAEARLAASQVEADQAAGKLAALQNELAGMRKGGASDEELAAKQAEIQAAAKALESAKAAGTLAEKDLETAKAKQEEAEKQASLQERLLDQLTKIEQFSQQAAGVGATIGAGISNGIKNALGGGEGGGGFGLPNEMFEKLKEKIRLKMRDAFKPIHEVWNEILQGFGEDAPNTLADKVLGKDAEMSPIEEKINALKEKFKEVFGPGGTLQTMVDNAGTLLAKSFADSVLDAILAVMKERWKDMWQPWRDILNTDDGLLVQLLNGLSTWLVGWLNTKATEWYNAGAAWVQGLIDGMGSMKETMKTWLSNFADKIKEWWKNLWGISSPSKVAMNKLGKPIAQGIAQAFEQYASIPQQSLSRMTAGLSLPAMTAGGGNWQSISKDQRRYTTANSNNTYNINDGAALAYIEDQHRRNQLSAMGVW